MRILEHQPLTTQRLEMPHNEDLYENFSIDTKCSITEALVKIDDNNRGFILVVENKEVIGCITDGDIRRAFINGQHAQSVGEICNEHFTYALVTDSFEKRLSKFSEQVQFLPILNNKSELVSIEFFDKYSPTTPKRAINSRAPARITFGGGGSDKGSYFKTHKGLCLNAAIKKFARANILISDGDLIIESNDYEKRWEFGNPAALIADDDPRLLIYQSLYRFLGLKLNLKIITSCDFPIGSGLGGSSALATALLGGIYNLLKIDFNNTSLAKSAYQFERLAMGIAGGWQDQYVSSYGGINAIFFTENYHEVRNLNLQESTVYELESTLFLCYSGISHDSSKIHKSMDLDEKPKNDLISHTVKLAEEMLSYLCSNDLSKFDENMNQNWHIKQQYSDDITSNELNVMINTLVKSGAASAKLLGAGGGGYFLFRVPINKQMAFAQKCSELNLIPERLMLEFEGLKVW